MDIEDSSSIDATEEDQEQVQTEDPSYLTR